MAKGWGPGTRERQHASRDTIPKRWGERTHPRTQAQLSLNRSALAAARLQLLTLASGVGKLPFANGSLYVGELPTRAPDPPTLFSLFASGVNSRPEKSKYRLGPRPSGLGSGGETRRERKIFCSLIECGHARHVRETLESLSHGRVRALYSNLRHPMDLRHPGHFLQKSH